MGKRGKLVHISSVATESWQSFLLSHAQRVVNIKLVKELERNICFRFSYQS